MRKNIIFLIALIPISVLTILKLASDNKKRPVTETKKLPGNDNNGHKKVTEKVTEEDTKTPVKEKEKPEKKARKEIIVRVNPDSGVYHLPECRYYNSKSCTLELTEKEALKKNFSKCKLEQAG